MSYALVSIVLPFYRQADHVCQAVDEYLAELAPLPVARELVLVPNGPDDGTAESCRKVATRCAGVRVVQPRTAGWGAAVKEGLQAARGDLLCYTNSARTAGHDLALLVGHALSSPGVVVKATRKVRENAGRRLGSVLYNFECRALFDLPSWDINGTPKAFPRVFDRLLRLEDDGDLIDLEFLVACQASAYPIVEIPIVCTQRRSSVSTTGLRTAVRLYVGAVAQWRKRRRSAQ